MSKTIIKKAEDCTPFELFQLQRYGNILKSQSYQRRRIHPDDDNPSDESAEAFEEWMNEAAEIGRENEENRCGSTFDHNF